VLTIFITPSYAVTLQNSTSTNENINLYELKDQTYYFPANYALNDKTVFLPLRRWDLIFTGDHINQIDDPVDRENINYVIPGPFNHVMVYMGKDSKGLAYAIELNLYSLEGGGRLSLICLGSDFGILRHPETQRIHDKRMMEIVGQCGLSILHMSRCAPMKIYSFQNWKTTWRQIFLTNLYLSTQANCGIAISI
jgi:hypothetical protein